jgi:ketosteroid isomerase-like protein
LATYTDDVEWRLIGGFVDLMGNELRGREAVRRFFDDWIENLGGRAEMKALLEANDQVVLVMSMAGAGGASCAPVTQRVGQVYSFRDGPISAVDNYWEANEALEAVGLSE